MIFSSIEFIIFFATFLLTIKFLNKFQRNLIIIFSLFFYAFWNLSFVLLILYFCITTYFFIKKNDYLKISIFIVILPLIYFKYSIFLLDTLNLNHFNYFAYNGEIPLAISFITFTAIAAIIDTKNKIFDKNLINFYSISEFILFFPQLIAGPILRLNELIPQLRDKCVFKKENIKFGLILFSVGFVKKIFFADNIGIFIDPIFENPEAFSSANIFKSFVLFPLQIYFDFSGYVDMALGSAIIIGIELPVNFNKPYLTGSITQFWRNWHITLSRWFKDYVYIPLGGSIKNKLITNRNLIFTMSIAGLWHGASLNFIIWGFLNGTILCIEKILNKRFTTSFTRIWINCFIIFNLWIIFRISNFDNLINYFFLFYSGILDAINFENIILLLIVIFAIFLQKYDNFYFLQNFVRKINLIPVIFFFIIIVITGLAINTGQSEKFIYFQF
jgi:alginate O-acetyltransferase complex protein AlgI